MVAEEFRDMTEQDALEAARMARGAVGQWGAKRGILDLPDLCKRVGEYLVKWNSPLDPPRHRRYDVTRIAEEDLIERFGPADPPGRVSIFNRRPKNWAGWYGAGWYVHERSLPTYEDPLAPLFHAVAGPFSDKGQAVCEMELAEEYAEMVGIRLGRRKNLLGEGWAGHLLVEGYKRRIPAVYMAEEIEKTAGRHPVPSLGNDMTTPD